MTPTPRSTFRWRLIRAVISGVLVATGIGLGAFNAWWVALFFGVPLVVAGIAVSPRPSRVSELPEFRRGVTADAPRVEVEALTRSSLDAGDLQPTLVTATISPPDDTPYRARWISSMTKGHFQALVAGPQTTLPPQSLPGRDQTETPEFDDQPGRRAVLYPAVTLAVAGALLFGVAQSWEISAPSLSSFDLGGGEDADGAVDAEEAAATLAERHRQMMAEIAGTLGPQATGNVLSLSYRIDSGSDQAIVFDPATGRATSINVWDGGSNSSAVPNSDRADKTFDAAAIDPTTLGDVAAAMVAEASPDLPESQLTGLRVVRPAGNAPVVMTGAIDSGDAAIPDREIQARPDGTIAAFFDPADFGASFDAARRALTTAGVPIGAPVLDDLVIRGIADNTPIISASAIQDSGGVLVDYTTPNRSGQVVIAPGHFPQVTERTGRYRPDGFAFDSVSPALFDAVRDDAMRRGSIPEYDRDAVAIEISDPPFFEDLPFAIRIAVARVEAADGLYAPDGRFIKQGHY